MVKIERATKMKRRSKWAKKCSECGKIIESQNKSDLCYFHFQKSYRKRPERKAYEKEYNQRPKVKLKRKECSKRYYHRNKDKFKKRYKNNKVELIKKSKIHYHENKERISKQQKEYYHKNRDKILLRQKEYYHKNKQNEQKPEIVTTTK